jgi:uncharacterized protein YndB with AHSA1/START domain
VSDPIVLERLIAASPAVVYRYLTESTGWTQWQGVDATIDARPGGLFVLAMADGSLARGEFVDLEPDRRVVFSWGWVDHPGLPPGSSTVEIELIAEGRSTRLRLTHHGLPPDEWRLHAAGWDHYLPRLAAAATGHPPGPDTGPAGQQ